MTALGKCSVLLEVGSFHSSNPNCKLWPDCSSFNERSSFNPMFKTGAYKAWPWSPHASNFAYSQDLGEGGKRGSRDGPPNPRQGDSRRGGEEEGGRKRGRGNGESRSRETGTMTNNKTNKKIKQLARHQYEQGACEVSEVPSNLEVLGSKQGNSKGCNCWTLAQLVPEHRLLLGSLWCQLSGCPSLRPLVATSTHTQKKQLIFNSHHKPSNVPQPWVTKVLKVTINH